MSVFIGKALRDARLSRNKSQVDVAKAMGSQRTYISRVERGIGDLSVGQFIRVSNAIEIEPYRILRYAAKLETNGITTEENTLKPEADMPSSA
jgi:transcriptional regulator with XRE-family HTH domain